MKKRLLVYVLALVVAAGFLPTAALASTLSEVQLYVDANTEVGLDGRVNIDFAESDGNYAGTLYLPGAADTGSLRLSWGEALTVAIDEVPYESGTAPIPAAGDATTYTVTADDGTASFTVSTQQASEAEGIDDFSIDTDETLGTIDAMQEPSSLSNVEVYVDADSDHGLNGKVNVSLTKSGNDYSGTVYLPGSADANGLRLSWETGLTLTADGSTYASGEAPIPAAGSTTTYVITAGDGTANLTLNTMQGSASIRAMFLDIDESLGTIAAMNSDSNHDTKCKGSVTLDGKTYYMTIKGRGNTTWSNFDKKPYNITTMKDDTYADKKKTKLIEGVEAKSWSILANAKDPTCLRNKIGYDIAQELGIGLPSENIDVWMNGQYLGNYLLTPKNDYQSPKNGYMVEIDNKNDTDQFTLSGSPLFTVKDMADGLTVDDVKGSVSAAWDALRDTSSDAYLEYFDLDSWAKMYLLQELYKDVDAASGSKFFTKATMDESSKLVAGPIWDLDGTLGRISTSYVSISNRETAEKSAEGWYNDNLSSSTTPFFVWLGKHESFMKRVYEMYNEYKAEFDDGILSDLATQRELISTSAEMNLARWPKLKGNEHFQVSSGSVSYGSGSYKVTYKTTDSWGTYADNLAEYIAKRTLYFSDKLTVERPVAGGIDGETTVDVLSTITLTADCTASAYQWQSSDDGEAWADIAGATDQTYTTTATTVMNGKFIRYVATNTGATIDTSRVADAAPSASAESDPVQLTVDVGEHVHSYVDEVTEPTCQHGGYTTHTCACGDSYVDSETDPIDHVYENGRCKFCGTVDPDVCMYEVPTTLAEGKLLMSVGGTEVGEFTFAQSGSNWTIQASDGRYLGFDNNAFAYASAPFAWSYTDGAFTTSVSNWGWWSTTYYLVYNNDEFSTSTSSSGSSVTFATEVWDQSHAYGDWQQADGEQHSRTCANCGHVDTEDCSYGSDDVCTFCGRINPHPTYTITWLDGDGNELKSEQVEKDQTPAYEGDTPTKTATDEFSYVFNGTWSPEIVAVSGDATYTAQFDEITRTYAVTFVDWDETVLQEATEYAYGTAADDIVKPADPNREVDNQYSYTFFGWSPEVADVTADATYTATYTKTAREFSVTVTTEPVALGETATFTCEVIGADPAEVSYLWQYSKVEGRWYDGTAAANDGATYTVRATEARVSSGQLYRCVVTVGGEDHASEGVGFDIPEPALEAVVTTSPVTLGDMAAFSCTVTGEGAEGCGYRWQYSKVAGKWYDCSGAGAASDTYTVRATEARVGAGQLYRCVVTAADGTQAASEGVGFDVPDPGFEAVVTTDQVGVGAIATFACEVTGEGAEGCTYQWQYSRVEGKWYDCTGAGAASATYSVRATQARVDADQRYRCVVTGPDGLTVTTEGVGFAVDAVA